MRNILLITNHFHPEEFADSTQRYLRCDLLILDDIGTEFITQFTTAVFYDIINTRLLRRRPTIISTNLNLDGLKARYDDRISSRLSGSYTRIQFVGSDIRIEVKKKVVRNS